MGYVGWVELGRVGMVVGHFESGIRYRYRVAAFASWELGRRVEEVIELKRIRLFVWNQGCLFLV